MRQKDMARNFAVVLQKQRKAKGLSQEILAEKADCDSTMISLIERKICNPTLNLADSLAQGLGIPMSQLIKEAEELRIKTKSVKRR
jgi:XRE family transcriptional regulator, regulator of sulfur utilization